MEGNISAQIHSLLLIVPPRNISSTLKVSPGWDYKPDSEQALTSCIFPHSKLHQLHAIMPCERHTMRRWVDFMSHVPRDMIAVKKEKKLTRQT